MNNSPKLDQDDIYRSALMPTTWGKRLTNYIIDYLVFFILFLTGVVAFGVYEGIGQDATDDVYNKQDEVLLNIVIVLLYAIYYTVLEYFLNGKTIGKMITKTRVVTTDGTKPNFSQILGRSFSRVIPFDAFSFISERPQGWHDRWVDTYVVDDSSLPDKIYLNPYY